MHCDPMFSSAYPVHGMWGGLDPVPAVIGWEVESTKDRAPVSRLTQGDRLPFRLTFTPMSNLDLPVNLASMSWDCGIEPELLERTHIGTGRTLHRKGPS